MSDIESRVIHQTLTLLNSIDMYAMQRGTARDISFLVDFLPSYLFPNGEKVIEKYGVTGFSLGGRSHDPCQIYALILALVRSRNMDGPA